MAEERPDEERALRPEIIDQPQLRIEINGKIGTKENGDRLLLAEAYHTAYGSEGDENYHWCEVAKLDRTASDNLVAMVMECLGDAVSVRIRKSLAPSETDAPSPTFPGPGLHDSRAVADGRAK